MRKFLATISLFVILAVLPISCGFICNNPCGCGPRFEVQDFTILTFETLSLTKPGQQVAPSTPLPYNQIFKAFRILDTQTIATTETDFEFSFPGIAFACSPETPKSVELMTGIQILNSKEVTFGNGTILKVGDDITKFFEINYFFSEETVSFESFFKQPITVYREDLFKLGLNQNPGKEVIMEFTIRIFMTGGKEFNLPNERLSVRE